MDPAGLHHQFSNLSLADTKAPTPIQESNILVEGPWELSRNEVHCLMIMQSNPTLRLSRSNANAPCNYARALQALKRDEPEAELPSNEWGEKLPNAANFLIECLHPHSEFQKFLEIYKTKGDLLFTVDYTQENKDVNFFKHEFPYNFFDARMTGHQLVDIMRNMLGRIEEELRSPWELSEDEVHSLAIMQTNRTTNFYYTKAPSDCARAFVAMNEGNPEAKLPSDRWGKASPNASEFLLETLHPNSEFKELLRIFSQNGDLKFSVDERAFQTKEMDVFSKKLSCDFFTGYKTGHKVTDIMMKMLARVEKQVVAVDDDSSFSDSESN